MKNKKKIIVVDDHEIIGQVFTRLLSDYDVKIAGNGEDAMKMIQDEPPALVLLDVQLPGVNGFEVLKKIKALDSRIPVIMIGGDDDPHMDKKARELGAQGSMVKPFDFTQVESMINKAVSQAE